MDSRLHISTKAMPERDRIPSMREFYGRLLMGIEIEAAPERAFSMELSTLLLPGIGIGTGRYSPLVARREKRFLSDGSPGILLAAHSHGFDVVAESGAHARATQDTILMAPLHVSSAWHYETTGDIRSIWVDANRIRTLLPSFDPHDIMLLPRSTPGLDLLFSYTRILETSDMADPGTRELAARQLAELAALVLGKVRHSEDIGARASLRQARLAKARRDVLASFQRQDLTIHTLAARHGVSARYMQMLFEEGGETFTEFLHALRLDFAHARLIDPRYRHERIADIAFEAGFSELTAFNRQFRRRFGMTPSMARLP